VIEEEETFHDMSTDLSLLRGQPASALPSPPSPIIGLDGGVDRSRPSLSLVVFVVSQFTLSLRHSLSRAYGIRVVTLGSNLKRGRFCVSGFVGALSFCGARVKNNGNSFTPLE
jgi:hypothetical protein